MHRVSKLNDGLRLTGMGKKVAIKDPCSVAVITLGDQQRCLAVLQKFPDDPVYFVGLVVMEHMPGIGNHNRTRIAE